MCFLHMIMFESATHGGKPGHLVDLKKGVGNLQFSDMLLQPVKREPI